jgi:hypothetical protein
MLENTQADPHTRSKEPIIPLATVIHEKKSGVDSKVYFMVANETISALSPTYATAPKPFVTDREFKADNMYIPNGEHVYCSNHLKNNLVTKAQRLGSSKEEQKKIKQDLHYMLKSTSKERYEEKRDELFRDKEHWQQPGLQDSHTKDHFTKL